MFIPNNFGKLSRKLQRNIYGEYSWADPCKVPCAVVDSTQLAQKTPVRADSSADRGASEEKTATVKILFPAHVKIGLDDKFEILGWKLRVVGITPRLSIAGKIDHHEVDMSANPK